ncbi:MAG TPA: dihydroxyacetone kinase subunit DhaL [Thermomicrobiaceae bacterium]|nr:dihydroxyacetone kinase subunit DhaL [Thermomicrobiaceae bacterium]
MAETESIGLRILRRIQAVIHQHAAELSALDRPIGDGDHGINLDRGFSAALAKVEAQEDQSLAAVLKTIATTLISTVGGAAGPLYGTAFLRAATAYGQPEPEERQRVAAAFEAALGGVEARGKATPGEKTMVDALAPAVTALREALAQDAGLAGALERAAAAAHAGMEATIPLLATKGRASYLGERSIGHQDPGATSCYLIMQAIADTVRDAEAGSG